MIIDIINLCRWSAMCKKLLGKIQAYIEIIFLNKYFVVWAGVLYANGQERRVRIELPG